MDAALQLQRTRQQPQLERIMSTIKNDGLLDILYDTKKLNYYVDSLIACLRNDKIFPPHNMDKQEEQCIKRAEATLQKLKCSSLVIYKQALIFMGLRISHSFYNMLAPSPTKIAQLHVRQRFLVNPDALVLFARGKKPKLGNEIYRFICAPAIFTVQQFVTSCIVSWMSLGSWLDHDKWSNMSPNATSVGLLTIGSAQNFVDNTHQLAIENDE